VWQTLAEVAAQDQAQVGKLEKALAAARQAAVAVILGEEPPAPETPPPAAGAASSEAAVAEGDGKVARGGVRQRKGKAAMCEIEEVRWLDWVLS
jgi:hypothetical protein